MSAYHRFRVGIVVDVKFIEVNLKFLPEEWNYWKALEFTKLMFPVHETPEAIASGSMRWTNIRDVKGLAQEGTVKK